MTNREDEGNAATRAEIGRLFRAFREAAALMQQDVVNASKGGISLKTLSAVEHGCYTDKAIGKAVEALNVCRRRRHYPPVQWHRLRTREDLVEYEPSWLVFPELEWLRKVHGPSSLLTADYRIVPFHGERSLAELSRLVAWCNAPEQVGIRTYKGAGGIGKTRLAIELCHALYEGKGEPWTTGFATTERFPSKGNPWKLVDRLQDPILVVVDYAGELQKTELIAQLLRHLPDCPAPKIRLLFLERDDFWLDRLHQKRGVRALVLGPLFSREGRRDIHELQPVAGSEAERADSLKRALQAFAGQLAVRKAPVPLGNLRPDFYRCVLYIHMRALLAADGTTATTKDEILELMLARERSYWKERLMVAGLGESLLVALEAAVLAISEADGVADPESGCRLLKKVALCRDQSNATIKLMVRALRECYPRGATGIGPLQPDELKFYFMSRF